MKIGIVTIWSEQGAGYVSRQFKDILESEHEVSIYARSGLLPPKNDKIWNDRSVTWDNRSILRSVNVLNISKFKSWIETLNPDIIFFNEQHEWEPVLLCKEMGIKVGSYIDYYTKETVPLFELYDFLICNTKRHYSVFNWHPQVYYIPWGTDIDLFKPVTQSSPPKDVTFFHSAGNNPLRKGTDLVIKAFSQLSENAKLVIHTQQNVSSYFPQLKDLIGSLIKEDKLIYYERTVKAPGLYYLGDVYVYPSRLEGIGLTIAEALASGLPVITGDNPPMNEFVNATNGSLVKISREFMRDDNYYWPQCLVDVNELCTSMQYYVDNIDQLPRLKAEARKYAVDHLNWKSNKDNILRIFEQAGMLSSQGYKSLKIAARNFDHNFSFKNRILRLFRKRFQSCPQT